jgi:hypothetical protein
MEHHQRSRREALDGYYSNPNYCLYCGKLVPVRAHEKACYVQRKKFCNKSCSAKYNNSKYPKRSLSKRFCKICGKLLSRYSESGKLTYRIVCDQCLPSYMANRYYGQGSSGREKSIGENTKGELFSLKGKSRARAAISRHARQVYVGANRTLDCLVCGYKIYTEVCHIKPVHEFSDETLIKEINTIDNLMSMCPNHHKEYDWGLLDLNEVSSNEQ